MGQIDREYEEKRDFIRMQMNSIAKLSVNGADPIDVTCQDLSANGISLISHQPVQTGLEVSIKVPSPNAQFQAMTSTGRVIRCDKINDSQYQIGVEITSIS